MVALAAQPGGDWATGIGMWLRGTFWRRHPADSGHLALTLVRCAEVHVPLPFGT